MLHRLTFPILSHPVEDVTWMDIAFRLKRSTHFFRSRWIYIIHFFRQWTPKFYLSDDFFELDFYHRAQPTSEGVIPLNNTSVLLSFCVGHIDFGNKIIFICELFQPLKRYSYLLGTIKFTLFQILIIYYYRSSIKRILIFDWNSKISFSWSFLLFDDKQIFIIYFSLIIKKILENIFILSCIFT